MQAVKQIKEKKPTDTIAPCLKKETAPNFIPRREKSTILIIDHLPLHPVERKNHPRPINIDRGERAAAAQQRRSTPVLADDESRSGGQTASQSLFTVGAPQNVIGTLLALAKVPYGRSVLVVGFVGVLGSCDSP